MEMRVAFLGFRRGKGASFLARDSAGTPSGSRFLFWESVGRRRLQALVKVGSEGKVEGRHSLGELLDIWVRVSLNRPHKKAVKI
jgi:hypothetical protein